eukprot:CAMPEP_0172789422 /NCGR_PEP_ID=MMETSP1074-20121228/207453_1 /TAXON_ID=2916 /ORGANISM="Ceratium fusus, Strain PA161109" /LENGTH=104 /DNA_ID=CAMNT_0013626459 /DNA_START=643 /DNA_END=954 /DNA_ORIENTATION=+
MVLVRAVEYGHDCGSLRLPSAISRERSSHDPQMRIMNNRASKVSFWCAPAPGALAASAAVALVIAHNPTAEGHWVTYYQPLRSNASATLAFVFAFASASASAAA